MVALVRIRSRWTSAIIGSVTQGLNGGANTDSVTVRGTCTKYSPLGVE